MVSVLKYVGGIHLRCGRHPNDGLGGSCDLYSNLPESYMRAGLAGLFVLAPVLAFVSVPRRLRTMAGFLVVFAGIVAWWLSIPASNERTWQPDVAVLPYATVKGEQVTIYNIRNLNYRTEADFDVR